METMTLLSSFDQQNWVYLLPESVLGLGLLVVLFMTLTSHKKTDKENGVLAFVSVLFSVLSLCALAWVVTQPLPVKDVHHVVMYGSLTADIFGTVIRAVLLLGLILSVLMSGQFLALRTRVVGDFYVLLMGATLGGMILSAANDLITVFVGLETLSITSYVLAGYLRKSYTSVEASLKYLIYGGMGTAILLFGLSMIYGLSGSTNLTDISLAMTHLQGVAHPTLILMLVMVFAALAFKLSLAPFHMWTPDVYEGAPTPVSGFLSTISKTAAFAITIRLMVLLFAGFEQWGYFLAIIAVLSMTLGNFVALKQTNVKRLLAYSTIAHAGYMLLGLMTSDVTTMGSLVFYLMTYVFMNLGAFACIIYFSNLTNSEEMSSFAGLIQKRPWLTLCFSICLLSLAGIPIASGFFAKFFLFQALATQGQVYLWFVGIALLNSTVSLAYYIAIIRMMVIKDPSPQVQAIPQLTQSPLMLSSAVSACVLATVLLGIVASPFWQYSITAVQQLMNERASVVSLSTSQ